MENYTMPMSNKSSALDFGMVEINDSKKLRIVIMREQLKRLIDKRKYEIGLERKFLANEMRILIFYLRIEV